MSAPADPNASTPSSSNLAGVTNGTAEQAKDTSELPPAALDLAAKLFDLARNGEADTLKAYMDAGVPPNLTNHAGDTLIMLTAYHNQPTTLSMLLSKRADPNVMNGRGQAPIAGAVFKGHEEIVRLLVRAGADVSLGQPNALDAARMFKREDLLGILRTGKGAENERPEDDRPWEGQGSGSAGQETGGEGKASE